MFKVAIALKIADSSPLELFTEDRKLARAAMQLCRENDLAVVVTEELEPRVVKFKDID